MESTTPGSDESSRLTVPLELYRSTAAETLERHAGAVIEHTNSRHAHELREAVAEHVGIPAADIAAADLLSLDRFGARVVWVDEAGAHTALLAFEELVESPSALTTMLRAHLR